MRYLGVKVIEVADILLPGLDEEVLLDCYLRGVGCVGRQELVVLLVSFHYCDIFLINVHK